MSIASPEELHGRHQAALQVLLPEATMYNQGCSSYSLCNCPESSTGNNRTCSSHCNGYFLNVSCFGANDGSISISGPAGGYGTYQYSVNGGTTWQGFGNFTNLIPGTYDVRIRDAANISLCCYS